MALYHKKSDRCDLRPLGSHCPRWFKSSSVFFADPLIGAEPFSYEIACCAHRICSFRWHRAFLIAKRMLTLRFRIFISGIGNPSHKKQIPFHRNLFSVFLAALHLRSEIRGLHRKLLLPHSRQNCNKNHAAIGS